MILGIDINIMPIYIMLYKGTIFCSMPLYTINNKNYTITIASIICQQNPKTLENKGVVN
jgi:hypothetical protein